MRQRKWQSNEEKRAADAAARERVLPPHLARMSKAERMSAAIASRQRKLAQVERLDPARRELIELADKIAGAPAPRTRTRADEFMS